MTIFWIMTALMASLAGLLVLAGARRGVDTTEAITAAASAAELDELDRLKARGLLDDAGWTAARAEAARRIITGEREAAPVRISPRDRYWVLGGAIATAALALGLYAVIARPGLADQSYSARIDEWESRPETLEAPQLAAVMGRAVAKRPGDHQALTLLGQARFEAGDPLGAASAFRRALALKPDDAQSWSRLGESLVEANRGAVDGDAEAAFTRALNLDTNQGGARYFLGEAALARGDIARARDVWGPLIASLDPADPRRAELVGRLQTQGPVS